MVPKGWRAQDVEAELETRRVYDAAKGSVSFRRITVPDAAPAAKEAKLQVLVRNLEDVVKRAGNDEKAFLRAGRSNLLSTMSMSAERGKQSILEREKAGELVLMSSDKSGKLAVMTPALYRECMEPHIAGDTEHTREEVTKMEGQFRGAATQILQVFKFGEDWGHQDRFKSAYWVENTEIPSLSQFVKDHKETLKTRAVFKAPVLQSPNGPLADLVCEILNMFVEEADKARRTEVKSTEELCSDIKAVNDRMVKNGPRRSPFQLAGNLVIGSKDVEAHYPEMDVEAAAEEAKREIEESDLEIEVDEVQLGLFLACSMTQEQVDKEGLTEVVHRRRFKNGVRPGLTYQAIMDSSSKNFKQT